jgi:uncharacterized RDD family membrane protein YckC
MKINPYVANANLIKRTGAATFDFFLFAGIGISLISLVFGPIYNQQFNTSTLTDNLLAYQRASFLYVEDPQTEQLIQLEAEQMFQGVYDYYAQFKVGKTFPTSDAPFVFSNSWFNTDVLKTDETTSYYQLDNDDANRLAIVKPNLDASVLSQFHSNIYQAALTDFATYPEVATLVTAINRYFLEVFLWSAGLSVLFVYIVLAMIMGNGRTLGKVIFNLDLVTPQGYLMQWWQVPLRGLGFTIILFTAPISAFFSILIAYTMMVFSKQYRTPHDWLASTRLVDRKKSLIFKDEAALDRYEATHPVVIDAPVGGSSSTPLIP